MIVYTSKDSFLEIPKGLGNFSTGGSADVEPLSGSVIELSATTVTLSGAVETLNESVDSMGDSVADLLLDVTELDTRVSGNTEDIAALLAQTTANTAHIETLSASTVAMNNSVTANTANIATLSGITSGLAVSVETLGEVKEDIYVYLKDLTAMTAEEKTAAWEALEEKYLAGHSIYLAAKSTNTTTDIIFPLTKYQPHKEGEIYTGYFGFSVIEGGGNAFYDVTFWQRGVILGNTGPIATRNVMYTLPKASSSKLGGIKVGSGVTMSGDFLNLEIGEGLGFSGNTLVVSGGSENGPRVIFLNKLTEQERIALYNELAAQYDYNAQSWTSAFTEDKYAFYLDLREYNDQDDFQTADQYEGFFPMQVVRMHPSDYGGGAFFTGVEQDRIGNGHLICIRFVINYEGQIDKGTWWNSPVNIGTTCVYIGPNGEYWGHRTADILYSEENIFKIAVKGCTESFSEEWGFGSFVYARRSDTGNGWYYQWSLIVPTNTGVMKGVWHCDESNGGSLGEVSTYVLDSWTAV